MKKRIFTLILALILVIGMIPAQANAETLGNGLMYEVYEDHVEIIGYTENAAEIVIPAEIGGKPVTVIGPDAFKTNASLESVTIPDSVTHIGNNAFRSCANLTDIVIPDSITHIGNSAFNFCTSLTDIVIPDGVTYIGDHAFSNCESLTDIVIPDSITDIADFTFYHCKSLTSITIPDSVTSIGEHAFSYCESLPSVFVPYSVTYIGDVAFGFNECMTGIYVDENNPNYSNDPQGVLFDKEKTKLILAPGAIAGSYVVPDGVCQIGDYSFSYCQGLTGIVIPESVTYIGDAAFYNCYYLVDVSIAEGATYIGQLAFSWCDRLTSIVIPSTVTHINFNAFSYNYKMTSIRFEGNPPRMANNIFTEVTAIAYYPAGNANWTEKVMTGYCGKITWISHDPDHTHDFSPTVTDPTCTEQGYTTYTCVCGDSYVADYVDALGHDCVGYTCKRCGETLFTFRYKVYADHVEITGCDGDVPEIIIPAEIEGLPVTSIGNSAFFGCRSLTSIVIPDSVTYIDNFAFNSCSGLTSITLPNSVTHIGNGVFEDCISLNSIVIPDSVTYIGDSAFEDCSSLTGIFIPDSVTFIGEGVFLYCNNLTEILVDENNPNYSSDDWGILFDKEKTALIQAPCTIKGSYVIPDSTTSIGNRAFYLCNGLTDIVIPEGATFIGNNAFRSCTSLTSIVIPDSVTSIGEQAFYYCEVLDGIHVDANNPVYSSDDRGVLFDKEKTRLICAPMTITDSYVIPDSVTHISDYAFAACKSLSGVVTPENLTWIGHYAFYSCDSLIRITIPEKVTEIGYYAFSFCDNLKHIFFMGDPPHFSQGLYSVFMGTTAFAYYPSDRPAWTAYLSEHQHLSRTTWISYNPDHAHDYSAVVTAPTCTEQGYTTYTCFCGNSYVDDYVAALGHECVDKVCIRCGEVFPTNFTDVPADEWFCDSVLWAVENGITTGTSEGSFSPNGQCLRAHVVTFLHRAANSPEPTSNNHPFTDVKSTDFFYAPVLWAVEEDITRGISATEFGSYSVCNRAAVVTFLWRAAGEPEPVFTVNPFTDVHPTDFYYKAVLWAVENEITIGLTATEFGPAAPCNRAQVVTFLYRTYN